MVLLTFLTIRHPINQNTPTLVEVLLVSDNPDYHRDQTPDPIIILSLVLKQKKPSIPAELLVSMYICFDLLNYIIVGKATEYFSTSFALKRSTL